MSLTQRKILIVEVCNKISIMGQDIMIPEIGNSKWCSQMVKINRQSVDIIFIIPSPESVASPYVIGGSTLIGGFSSGHAT